MPTELRGLAQEWLRSSPQKAKCRLAWTEYDGIFAWCLFLWVISSAIGDTDTPTFGLKAHDFDFRMNLKINPGCITSCFTIRGTFLKGLTRIFALEMVPPYRNQKSSIHPGLKLLQSLSPHLEPLITSFFFPDFLTDCWGLWNINMNRNEQCNFEGADCHQV